MLREGEFIIACSVRVRKVWRHSNDRRDFCHWQWGVEGWGLDEASCSYLCGSGRSSGQRQSQPGTPKASLYCPASTSYTLRLEGSLASPTAPPSGALEFRHMSLGETLDTHNPTAGTQCSCGMPLITTPSLVSETLSRDPWCRKRLGCPFTHQSSSSWPVLV